MPQSEREDTASPETGRADTERRRARNLAGALARAGLIDHELSLDRTTPSQGARIAEAELMDLLAPHLTGPVLRTGPWRYGVAAGSDPSALAAALTTAMRAAGHGGRWRLAPVTDVPAGPDAPDPAAIALLARAGETGQSLAGATCDPADRPLLLLSAGFCLAVAQTVLAGLDLSAGDARASEEDSHDHVSAPSPARDLQEKARLDEALASLHAGIGRLEAAQTAPSDGDAALPSALERLERLRSALQGQFRRLDAHEAMLADLIAGWKLSEGSEADPAMSASPAAAALADALSEFEARSAARHQTLCDEMGALRSMLGALLERVGWLEAPTVPENDAGCLSHRSASRTASDRSPDAA